ncbi:MAG: hypothetical protein ABI743_04395 [bacterium]
MPEYGSGRWVALTALLRPQGATEKEVWETLRTHLGDTWNDFNKVNNGYGVINQKDGWGLFTDEGSGRTFAYSSDEDLELRLGEARKLGFIQ